MLKTSFSIVFLMSVASSAVVADDYHYVNNLIGDRAASMAGAYIAISDDPSGLYYNPAGVVYTATSNLSASMNAFHFSTTRYKNVLGGKDWERTSSGLIPNFFGTTQPLGKGTVGFSYAVVDTSLEDQNQTFSNVPVTDPNTSSVVDSTFNIDFNNQDTTYNIGPSYARPIIDKKLSVGATLYGYYRTKEQISNQLIQVSSIGKYHWENTYYHLDEYGVKPIVGIMYSPIDKISMGLTFTKTIIAYSKRDYLSSCSSTLVTSGNCTNADAYRVETIDQSKRVLPITTGLGIAYFPTPALVLSFDTNIYEPLYGQTKPIINSSLGAEYYLAAEWAVRVGAYTNFANTPLLSSTNTGQAEHIDYYGGALGITHFTRASSLTVGISGSMGQGKAQVISGHSELQSVEAFSISGYMSASYSI